MVIALLIFLTSCAQAVTHELAGSVSVFDFGYHSNLIIEQAQRLAGGDYYGLPEEERDAVWIEAAGLVRGTPCEEGIEPFPEIRSGAVLQIVDANDVLLGTGTLSGGFVDLLAYPEVQAKVIAVCRFDFDVLDIPDGARYTLRIDDRQLASLTREQLEASKWAVALEVGVQR